MVVDSKDNALKRVTKRRSSMVLHAAVRKVELAVRLAEGASGWSPGLPLMYCINASVASQTFGYSCIGDDSTFSVTVVLEVVVGVGTVWCTEIYL